MPPKRVCRRPSPHWRVSRPRGQSFDCDFRVACKISRLARGAISFSARPAAPASDNLRRMGCLGCTRLTVPVELDAPFQKKGVRGRAAGAAAETDSGAARRHLTRDAWHRPATTPHSAVPLALVRRRGAKNGPSRRGRVDSLIMRSVDVLGSRSTRRRLARASLTRSRRRGGKPNERGQSMGTNLALLRRLA